MSQRKTLYLLDAYSLIFQVFHALPAMNAPDGRPTNAAFGVFRDLLNIRHQRKPDFLVAAFDGAGRVFRSDIDENYKANRAAMPDDLKAQFPTIERVYGGFRVPILRKEGYEADDLIATLARIGVEQGCDVVICTADKDARQLIGPHVSILNLRKNQVMDAPALEADWGVRPDQVVDLLALTGDTVDNVPGIPGIGVKTAADLLKSFDTLDNILANIDKVSGKKRQENLREHGDTARRARTLVLLESNVPLPDLQWDTLALQPLDIRALKDLCIESGFHGFLNEIAADAADNPTETSWDTSAYQLIDTPEAFRDFLNQLRQQKKFAFDTETTSVDPLRASLVGLSFSWQPAQAAYIAVRGPMNARTLDTDSVLAALAPILADPDREIVGQNLKYDLLVLSRYGLNLSPRRTDTMILSYLLESGERNHNLDELSCRLLDHTMIPITSLIGKGKNQLTMDQVDTSDVATYAAEDADAAWRLEALLSEKVRSEGLWPLYDSLERPLIGVLADMERIGIRVDRDRLRTLSREFGDRLATIRAEIHDLAGGEFNIGSGPQLRTILFDKLKLPSVKKTPKGEPSTDAEALEELSALHPLPKKIVEYRGIEKLKSTYLDTLPELAHDDDRIHTSFNQVVAATGRLSSSDPNLQNIPTRTEDGRQIRQAFVAGQPGWSLLTADYSQIELRILAHYSKDPRLIDAFTHNQDIHAAVAATLFNVPVADVTRDQRRVAKTLNFAVIYGVTGFGLASRLGIPRARGDEYVETYFAEHKGVADFITRTLTEAKQRGRVETILGRRRATAGIKFTDRMRTQAERIAVNAVIQGSAADLIKKAMIDLHNRLKSQDLQARMLLQIHDELVLEAPDSEIELLARLVRDVMTHAIPFDVPLVVDIAAGPNWLDVKPVAL
jgi:DNA polymerase-1